MSARARVAAGAEPWRLDLLVLGLLAAVALATKLPLVSMERPPFEDAAMVMRYAEHLAQGHGIVWNVGDAPLDGATDFLFLLLLGGLRALGVPVETGVRALGLASHLLTIALVYLGNVRGLGVRRPWAAAAALYLAVGPGFHYVAACFATPFFGLFAATTWLLAQRIERSDGSRTAAYAFALSGFAMGLARPEGVFLAGFMLLSLVLFAPADGRPRLGPVGPFVAVFALLGGAYFAWRWSYFGHPLPNPFYKKGGGVLHPESLVLSIRNVAILLFPFLPVYVAGLFARDVRRAAAFYLLPVVLFTVVWILLSNEMNYLFRFQYATLPIAMLSCPRLLEGLLAARAASGVPVRRPALLLTAGLALAAVSPYLVYHVFHHETGRRDGRRDVGLALRPFAARGYTLATTEAGLLPLYSGWRSIDAWGLNDAWIAHNGGVTRAYLERNRPQVIMIHAWFSPGIEPAGSGDWFKMQKVLYDFAESEGYVLAAVPGVQPRDTHYYYVERGLPETEEIVRRIRGVDYFWYANDRRSKSYLP